MYGLTDRLINWCVNGWTDEEAVIEAKDGKVVREELIEIDQDLRGRLRV